MDIILATGGTGGHIFPAMTLAKALELQGYSCILFTNKKIDKNTDVESYTLPLCKPSSSKFKFFLLLTYSFILALCRIKKLKPRLVIGFGSYASFPTLLAAKILFIPVILHEQNIVLGRVNRFFLNSAELIATSFPETKYVESNRCIFTGNFVYVRAQDYSYIHSGKSLNILVIAASQGASFFDDVVSDVICNLPIEVKKKLKVIQQCTKKNINKVKGLYKSVKVNSELSEFFNDMESRLASAHLVISRAGATSIAEITLAGRPAIYIPYPYSKDGHQFYNAKYIESLGAAVIIEQNGETKRNLKELLIGLLGNTQKLSDMANNTKKARVKNGVNEFIKVIAQRFG
ncbi:UDP-N-acetylglucosamine--N-acetylmuramyl-(pentapeptide) pyrophosphoryl-undecaprenol N-acetylglucosamine transferase [Wolbachia endosymbiont of Dirofilaria (Dirofilaria) immitis]|uniref:UDP-N-acetylglucosamine--N-acetylmuramyl- (pentapeptide) pyrophosphoryl-undecaprenol N-acetylglucosamine transferase n=1 Tax=Wolbachia endosymbiont of Dirofilaria (Dirofilaria) immitis TaxID=1812115 RepID=UPI00158EFD45|nr:UDP-N-acetylglucosamine--N-acetylmuramyl-(pentapeptide) pyrophosphoryl-undecaprenol N-acetylglucosamine transferase [Wolbachia endosymbiont of Dirofilaria (Dirofilaria) immitis]QKX02355.1 UDP-N-acetylglucosamine--N-acetylmuramyl-(pentapeptide) pyrophosphoryl-undecaprenol N-acetylglucosamine transferase [Wolbachia endosymbiont of Dirofilaria (Dirofilaria) immitis]